MGLAKALQGAPESFKGYTTALGKKEERDFLSKEAEIRSLRDSNLRQLEADKGVERQQAVRTDYQAEFDEKYKAGLEKKFGTEMANAFGSQYATTGQFDPSALLASMNTADAKGRGTNKMYEYLDEGRKMYEALNDEERVIWDTKAASMGEEVTGMQLWFTESFMPRTVGQGGYGDTQRLLEVPFGQFGVTAKGIAGLKDPKKIQAVLDTYQGDDKSKLKDMVDKIVNPADDAYSPVSANAKPEAISAMIGSGRF